MNDELHETRERQDRSTPRPFPKDWIERYEARSYHEESAGETIVSLILCIAFAIALGSLLWGMAVDIKEWLF